MTTLLREGSVVRYELCSSVLNWQEHLCAASPGPRRSQGIRSRDSNRHALPGTRRSFPILYIRTKGFPSCFERRAELVLLLLHSVFAPVDQITGLNYKYPSLPFDVLLPFIYPALQEIAPALSFPTDQAAALLTRLGCEENPQRYTRSQSSKKPRQPTDDHVHIPGHVLAPFQDKPDQRTNELGPFICPF